MGRSGGPTGPVRWRTVWTARFKVQLAALIAFNGYVWAPWGRFVCVPVLNCYACSIATTACPIGTITAFAIFQQVPFYVIGALGLAGATVGRAFCGWGCPFGLVQDLLYRIRAWRWRLPRGANALKYVLLVVLVVAVPFVLAGGSQEDASDRIVRQSTGAIDYCALVCPVGTLEAGLPSLMISKAVRADMSWRSWLKLSVLAMVIGLSIVSRRGFCRTLCPLGALMAGASRLSLLRLETDLRRCTHCGACVAACPTRARQVPDGRRPKEATAECVDCLDCVAACPEPAALRARMGVCTVMVSHGRAAAISTTEQRTADASQV
ncbi:MAG: 4Fe-4S binding protein [Armatimonadota bacterium]